MGWKCANWKIRVTIIEGENGYWEAIGSLQHKKWHFLPEVAFLFKALWPWNIIKVRNLVALTYNLWDQWKHTLRHVTNTLLCFLCISCHTFTLSFQSPVCCCSLLLQYFILSASLMTILWMCLYLGLIHLSFDMPFVSNCCPVTDLFGFKLLHILYFLCFLRWLNLFLIDTIFTLLCYYI